MDADAPLLVSQIIVRVCLFAAAAIALFGGVLQMSRGQPDTEPRLDNVHRFLAGIYLGTGLICLWTGATIRQQGPLVYLIALGILLGAVGRLISMSRVGLPQPAPVWLAYLISELVLPVVIATAQYAGA